MPSGQGRRRGGRRITPGIASAILAVILLPATACNRLPLRQVDATPSAKPMTRVEPATPPAELPPLPATPLTEASSTTPPAPERPESAPEEEPGRGTPLLDAALARASDVKAEEKAEKPIELPVLSAAPEKSEPKLVPSQTSAAFAEVESAAPEAIIPLPDESSMTLPRSLDHEHEPHEIFAKAPDYPATESAPRPIDVEKPIVGKPRDPWLDGLGDLRAFAARHGGEPGGNAETWVIRSRVIDWLSADSNDSPSDVAWSSVLSALVAATGPETIEPSILAPKLHEAVANLESLAPLAIVDLKLCRKVQGFGHREILEPAAVKPGQALLVYCEISGLRYEKLSEGFKSQMASDAEITLASGGEPVWTQALGSAEDHCRLPRHDYFVNYRIPLPPSLAPGDYQLRLTQRDLLSGRDATATVSFHIIP